MEETTFERLSDDELPGLVAALHLGKTQPDELYSLLERLRTTPPDDPLLGELMAQIHQVYSPAVFIQGKTQPEELRPLLERLRTVPLDDPLLDGLLAQIHQAYSPVAAAFVSDERRYLYAFFGLVNAEDRWIARQKGGQLHVVKRQAKGPLAKAKAFCGATLETGPLPYGSWGAKEGSSACCSRCAELATGFEQRREMSERPGDPISLELSEVVEARALLNTVNDLRQRLTADRDPQAQQKIIREREERRKWAERPKGRVWKLSTSGRHHVRSSPVSPSRDEYRINGQELRLITELDLGTLVAQSWRKAYADVLLAELRAGGDEMLAPVLASVRETERSRGNNLRSQRGASERFLIRPKTVAEELAANEYQRVLTPARPRLVDLLKAEQLLFPGNRAEDICEALGKSLVLTVSNLQSKMKQEVAQAEQRRIDAALARQAAAAASDAVTATNEYSRVIADLRAIERRHSGSELDL